MNDAVIEVQDLARTYHAGDVEVHALRGVNLSIGRGEFVAIMGSSGSGKSTMMAILGCLDRPTSGRYLFEGVDVAELSEPELARIRSQRIGFVFQSFNLLARTSALENAALPLFYSSDAPPRAAERNERARHALELLGLGHRAGNTPAQLSGGEQQRVAIARALINCAERAAGRRAHRQSRYEELRRDHAHAGALQPRAGRNRSRRHARTRHGGLCRPGDHHARRRGGVGSAARLDCYRNCAGHRAATSRRTATARRRMPAGSPR